MRSRLRCPLAPMWLGLSFMLLQLGCSGTTSTGALQCLNDGDCPPACTCVGEAPASPVCRVPTSLGVGLECGGACTRDQPCPAGSECEFDRTEDNVAIYACSTPGPGELGDPCTSDADCDPNASDFGAYCCLEVARCGVNLNQCVEDCSTFSSGMVGGELSECQDNRECETGFFCCLVPDDPAACDFSANLSCTCLGVCDGVVCGGDGNECTAGSCDPADGQCKYTAIEDGTPCGAGQGSCMSGACVLRGLDGCGEVSQTYQDGDFADGDWTFMEVAELSEGTRGIARVETKLVGGNPEAYREVEIVLTATAEQQAAIWVAHALGEAVYDPGASGEICGVRFFLDGTDQFDPLVMHNAIFSVFLHQNDTYYWAARRWVVTSDTWERSAWTMPGDRFVRVGDTGPEAPDFSASGAPIQFGYLGGNSRPTSAPGTGMPVGAADNFKVEIFSPAP